MCPHVFVLAALFVRVALAGQDIIFVGTWGDIAGLHLFMLNSTDGSLVSLGTSNAAGLHTEALLVVPNDDESATLVAVNNPCCDTCAAQKTCIAGPVTSLELNGSVVSLAVSATYGQPVPSLEQLSSVSAHGRGPNALAHHQAGFVIVADYWEGVAAMLPFDPASGMLSPASAVTRPLGNRSCDHFVAVDGVCGTEAAVAVVDACAPAISMYDLSGQLLSTTKLMDRARHFAVHPSLPLAYLIYEFLGEVGVWPWEGCTGSFGLGDAEITRVSLGVPTAPSEIIFSPAGDFLYVSGRGMGDGSQSIVAAFAVDADGMLRRLANYDVDGSPRAFALSSDGEFVLVADQVGGTLTSWRRDLVAGTLVLCDSVGGMDQPVSVAVWSSNPRQPSPEPSGSSMLIVVCTVCGFLALLLAAAVVWKCFCRTVRKSNAEEPLAEASLQPVA